LLSAGVVAKREGDFSGLLSLGCNRSREKIFYQHIIHPITLRRERLPVHRDPFPPASITIMENVCKFQNFLKLANVTILSKG
jgi:hypothetical protein